MGGWQLSSMEWREAPADVAAWLRTALPNGWWIETIKAWRLPGLVEPLPNGAIVISTPAGGPEMTVYQLASEQAEVFVVETRIGDVRAIAVAPRWHIDRDDMVRGLMTGRRVAWNEGGNDHGPTGL